MFPQPAFIPVKPRVRRNRHAIARPAPPPPLGLTITSVVYLPATSELIVHFSGAIVWNGIDVPSEFKAFTEDGYFDSPIDVRGAGPDWIHLEFNAGAPPGSAWELLGPMAGITPDVAFPQT